ncbi:MAG: serine dehydratase subunit alpha family protein [Clostridia bacterium]|nr:serine dehydratase subunit alpha family protein [Clostridia bacterium]
MTHEDITKLLKKEMVPALGCTGPTAYALAAARCKPYLTAEPTLMNIYVSPAFLKIGFGVATPGTSEPGIGIAAAIGLVGGDYMLGMEVLKPCTSEDVENAQRMVDSGKVKILSDWDQTGVYVRAEIMTENETVVTVLSGTHDGIVSVAVNGKEMFHADVAPVVMEEDALDLTPDIIFDYIKNVNTQELRFLLDGYKMNTELAEDGIKGGFGLKSGCAYLKSTFKDKEAPADLFENPLNYLPSSLEKKVQILVSAASDARMGGSRFPAMAAMGDGNQGITAILPVGLAAEEYNASEEQTIRALALACLMLFFVKVHIGRASAFCMCAIAASAGAAAGICYLKGLDEKAIRAAVKNAISTLAGMLCDGAKNGCALKMSVAAATALTAVELAEAGVEVGYFDGVADDTLERTVSCITSIATKNMDALDACMVENILAKEERRR